MELTSVAEASRRLGLTEDTVKRRLRKGELSGQRKPRPQGYVWLVELPEEEDDPPSTVTDTRSTAGDDRVSVTVLVEKLIGDRSCRRAVEPAKFGSWMFGHKRTSGGLD